MANATKYWFSERAAAIEKLGDGFIGNEYTLLWARDRIPPVPSSIELEVLINAELTTKWKIEGPRECSSTGAVLEKPGPRLALSSQRPVSVNFTADCFKCWLGPGSAQQTNLISILALAWCYVLSAKWLESDDRRMKYIVLDLQDSKISNLPRTQIPVEQNNASYARWLHSIHTPETGYDACFTSRDGITHWSPWAVSLEANIEFTSPIFGDHAPSLLDDADPLTSAEALEALRELCLEYQIPWMQIEASLGVALLVPLHRVLGVPLRLPQPSLIPNQMAGSVERLDISPLSACLPALMTLSSAYELLNSSLCGAFWNPAVSRNILSAWVQALEDAHNTEFEHAHIHKDEVLAAIGARRAPSMGLFLFAAAATGLLPKIIMQVCSGQPPLDRCASVWTGIPQSFMDVAEHGEYGIVQGSHTYLRRSDCW